MQGAMHSIAARAYSVKASIEKNPVLMGVNACFAQGRWTSVVGPNGAGKSTLLKVLAGLLPYTGKLDLLDKPLAAWSRAERARSLSWLGQNEAAANDLSVFDVAMLGRMPHMAHRGWLSAASQHDHAVVEQSLRATQAWDWRARSLGALSGGERQRVLLARLLAVQARVVLMDEPLANLDPPHQADWLAIVRSLVAQGTTVISVLHEISVALHADDMAIMAGGLVTYQGACANASTHRALEAVFDKRISVLPLSGQWIALPK